MVKDRLLNKAKKSRCRFKVAACALNHKGEILGFGFNSFRLPNHGGGIHAEMNLIRRYKKNISKIIICRVGLSGNSLPIDPCPVCKRIAEKLGIKIESIKSGNRYHE